MRVSSFTDVKISAVAAAVSNDWTAIADISDEDPAVLKKFTKTTGVKGRYNAGVKQTTSDFCFAAAEKIIREKNINAKEIGVLIFVTQTADYGLPSTACLLQDRLGISQDSIAFDVNLGCSGFSYGVNIAASLMKASNTTKALLLAGDTSAKERSQKRRQKTTHAAGLLFGDSGTAVLLEIDKSARPINMISRTDGSGYKAIISPYGAWRNPDKPKGEQAGTRMDDVAVFNFALAEVPDILKKTMDLARYTQEDYDCLVLHQANLFMLKQIAKRAGFSPKQNLISLDMFGNTSASSLPITLVKEYGDLQENREIHSLMCGFGVGLSWSTVDCYININDILPLIHTDDYFIDGYPQDESTNKVSNNK